jgi:hypothetical protein
MAVRQSGDWRSRAGRIAARANYVSRFARRIEWSGKAKSTDWRLLFQINERDCLAAAVFGFEADRFYEGVRL